MAKSDHCFKKQTNKKTGILSLYFGHSRQTIYECIGGFLPRNLVLNITVYCQCGKTASRVKCASLHSVLGRQAASP